MTPRHPERSTEHAPAVRSILLALLVVVSVATVPLVAVDVATAGATAAGVAAAAAPSADHSRPLYSTIADLNETTEVEQTGDVTEASHLNAEPKDTGDMLSEISGETENFWSVRVSDDEWYGFSTAENGTANDDVYLVTSSDGQNWNIANNGDPIIDSANDLEDPSVVREGGTWYMYLENSSTADTVNIFTASSPDGTWTLESTFTNTYGPQSPIVVVQDGTFTMLYEVYDNNQLTPYTRYATSSDGLTWTDKGTAMDLPNTESVPDGVIDRNGKWYLYYHDMKNRDTANQNYIRVAEADSLTGPYENVEPDSKLLDYRETTQSALTQANVQTEPDGTWAGTPTNEVVFYIWGPDINEFQIWTGSEQSYPVYDTDEEDGDLSEYDDDELASHSINSTDPGLGTYKREVTTTGTATTFDKVYRNLTATVAPDTTRYWLTIPESSTDDGTVLQMRWYEDGQQIAAVGWDNSAPDVDPYDIGYYDGTNWHNVGNYTGKTTHRVTLDWDWQTDEVDIYLDGELTVENAPIGASVDGYDQVVEEWDNDVSSSGLTAYVSQDRIRTGVQLSTDSGSSGASQTLSYQDNTDGVTFHDGTTRFTVARQDTSQLQQNTSAEWVEVDEKQENWQGQATFDGLSTDETYRATLTLEHYDMYHDEVGWSPGEVPDPWVITVSGPRSADGTPTVTTTPGGTATGTATAYPDDTTVDADGTYTVARDDDGLETVEYTFTHENGTTYNYTRTFDDPPEWYSANFSSNETGIDDPSEWSLNYSAQDSTGEWTNGTTTLTGSFAGSTGGGGAVGPLSSGSSSGPSPLELGGLVAAGAAAVYFRKPERRAQVRQAVGLDRGGP